MSTVNMGWVSLLKYLRSLTPFSTITVLLVPGPDYPTVPVGYMLEKKPSAERA